MRKFLQCLFTHFKASDFLKASYLGLLGLTVLIASCSKLAEVEPGQAGYDYFPLESGRYTVYDLTDITYSLTAPILTERYQVKEVVRETYTDQAGLENYRIERFIRPKAGDEWTLDSVWSARRTATQALRVENNIHFMKIVFPVKDEITWNGNVFNDRLEEEYRLKSVAKPFLIDGQPFNETLTVQQSADSSLVGQDKRFEVYARNIGLIYKEKVVVQYCSATDCLGQGRIDFGTRRIQKIIGYGNE
jgi:hypothetical protein